MNVIVANERKNELNSLNIDIIKSVDGVYTVEELIGMFTNFFFNKMILDVTSIKDYSDYGNLKKLFTNIDASKIILFLNEESSSKEFISDLITLGVYNFTGDFNEIMNLFNNPKTFNDVASLQISKSTFDINKEIDESLGVNQESEFTFEDFTLPGEYDGDKKIIGVVNMTEHAGATSLVVQMVKQLNVFYNAIGIEMNKLDFMYFKTTNIYSCTSKEDVLRKVKEHQDADVIVVDLNTYNATEFCNDIIYLVEPGTIKLSKLFSRNSKALQELSGKKIVLNRTNMDDGQVSEFEVETKCKVFSVVNNFKDTSDRVQTIDNLLANLGYTKCGKDVKKGGLFSKFS